MQFVALHSLPRADTVDVSKDLKTAGHLKEHIIGMVCKRSGVYLIRNHATLSDRITRMPRPYNMPFDTLLESVTGKSSLNLCLNLWTVSYRFALRYHAFYLWCHRRSRAIGRLDRHHRSSRADLHRRHSVMAKDRPTIQ